MNAVNPDFIEKYQAIYEKDPDSKVFAPLAEGYRKMKLTAQALRVAERGVRVHPHFASGRVTLGKILIDLKRFEDATEHLNAAVEITPDNLLAHQLLADCHLKTRNARQALDSYKMVLFLNPADNKAAKIVHRLESLTADEFPEELFELVQENEDFISKKLDTSPTHSTGSMRGLERYVSLIDAFIVRNDLDKASKTIERAEMEYPSNPEIIQRRKLINERHQDALDNEAEEIEPLPSRSKQIYERKMQILNNLMRRIEQYQVHS